MVDIILKGCVLFQQTLVRFGVRFGTWEDVEKSEELYKLLNNPINQERIKNVHIIPEMIQRRLKRGQNLYDRILRLHSFRYSFLKWRDIIFEIKEKERIKKEKQREKRKEKKKQFRQKKRTEKEIEALKKSHFKEIAKCQNFVGKLMVQMIKLKLDLQRKSEKDAGNLKLITFSERLLEHFKKTICISNPVLKVLHYSYANNPVLISKMSHWELTLNMSDEQITHFGEDCHLVISREKMELLINSIGRMYIKTLKKNMIKQSFSRWKIISKIITTHQKNQLMKEKEKKKEIRIDNRNTLTKYDEFMHSEFLRRKEFEESCLDLD